MTKRLVHGMFSSITDAELATELFQYESKELEKKSSQEQKPDVGEDNNWLPS